MLDSIKIEEADKPSTLPPGSNLTSNYVPTLAETLIKARRILLNSPWYAAALLLALVALVIAYQFSPVMKIEPGRGYDRPYLNLAENGFSYSIRYDYDDGQSLFVSRENANTLTENYRWTHSRPILLLPGIGEAARLQLRAAASPLYPKGQQVEILLNGQPFTSFQLEPGLPKQYDFDLSQSRYPTQGGNLAIEMRVKALGPVSGELIYAKAPNSDTYLELPKAPSGSITDLVEAPKDGFKLYDVAVTPKGGGVIPPSGITLSLLLATIGVYFTLAYCGLATRFALGTAALFIGVAALMLAIWRLELTIYAGRLALLLIVAALALPLLDVTLPRLFRRWELTLPRWAWKGLLALFLIGLLLRGGGVLYPQAVIIDSPYHLFETGKVAQGQLVQEYFNRDLSKVPGQWQSEAVIPYSTITYFLFAPFAKLPLDPAVSINLVNILLDAVRVFIIFGLATALGVGARAALIAASLYLFIPSTWLVNSWGNWPTTLSFWMAVLYLTLALVLYRSLNLKRVWFSLTALLTLTMMVYSVTAVFMGMLLYIWAAGLFFFTGRNNKIDRRNGKLLFASATVAGLGSVVLYYWQFLPDVYTTLTSFDKSLSSGAGLGLEKRDFLDYLAIYFDNVFNRYGMFVLLGLALVVYAGGLISSKFKVPGSKFNHREILEAEVQSSELKKRESSIIAENTSTLTSRTLNFEPGTLNAGNLWFIGAWFAVFFVFGVAQWKVDMVDKQVWFIVPLVCALASVALLFLWEKLKRPVLFYGGRLAVVALMGWLSYSSITLWIYRIFFKRH